MRITDDHIAFKSYDNSTFFIYWDDFNRIDVEKVNIRWYSMKRLLRFIKFEYKIRFFLEAKYLKMLELNSRHFYKENIEDIFKGLKLQGID